MALTLGKKERALLCALDCNSRRSLSVLGKETLMSKESVHYQIRQLEKNNIILGYPTIVSLSKMGKIHAEMYLSFHNVTPALKQEMISFFSSQKDIVSVITCKGNWDLLLGIIVDSVAQLNTIKNSLCAKYALYFRDLTISFTIENYFFGRTYLMGKNIHMTQHVDKPGKDRPDVIDSKILSHLSENARSNLVQIARAAGISSKSAAQRIKKMQKNKIIQKFTLALNLDKLHMSSFKLLIRLKNIQYKKRFIEYFQKQPNTVGVREVLASWNIEPSFEVSSPEEFYAIVQELEDKFGEYIMSHTALILDKTYKSHYY